MKELAAHHQRSEIALGLFQRLGARWIRQLGWEHLIGPSRLMPHFALVQANCERAFIRHITDQATRNRCQSFCDWLEQQSELPPRELINWVRSRYRKVDPASEWWILTCWVHGGLWLFSNQDRYRLLSALLGQGSKELLKSAEAFRKRRDRLGLIGWNTFPSTYRVAPLCYHPSEQGSPPIWVDAAWKDIFLQRPIAEQPSLERQRQTLFVIAKAQKSFASALQ